MGFQPQVVEVSDVSVVNLGQVALKGIIPNAYEGAEADALWRKQAAERIDKLRKANLTIEVRDAAGKPVSGASVQVRMKRHAFWFGSAVAGKALSAPGPDRDRYRKEVLGLFNSVVLENDLKWPQWESSPSTALEALTWLHTNGISRIRGHNLIWPGLKNMPWNTRALISDPPALRKRILDHIAEETAAVRGKVSEWDVINEPFSNFDVQKVLGDAEMIAWFQAARKQDAIAAMFINDYDILSAGGADLNHQRHYFNTIKQLIDGGAPLDGIGMQAHLGRQLASPARVLEVLDRFGRFGKQIRITEFDINIADEELQAAYTRDFMTAFFSHPSASGFLMWGFWEGRHWLPKGAMFRRDWSLKPNGQVYKDLVFRDWWTNADGATGKNGNYGVRGFRGDYEVSVAWNGKSKTVPVSLDKDDTVIPITIP
jgi:GH35 family endo-1,4-beta-xylanase